MPWVSANTCKATSRRLGWPKAQRSFSWAHKLGRSCAFLMANQPQLWTTTRVSCFCYMLIALLSWFWWVCLGFENDLPRLNASLSWFLSWNLILKNIFKREGGNHSDDKRLFFRRSDRSSSPSFSRPLKTKTTKTAKALRRQVSQQKQDSDLVL